MNISRNLLIPLQKIQKAHDEKSHKDVMSFDLHKRLKHMVLHFYKYAGKIQMLKNNYEQEKKDIVPTDYRDDLRRILIDVFIIAMSSANALNVSLDETVTPDSIDGRDDLSNLFQHSVNVLVVIGGQMAKAMEAADHMEDGNPQATMKLLVPLLTQKVLCILDVMSANVYSLALTRLHEVEEKSIF